MEEFDFHQAVNIATDLKNKKYQLIGTGSTSTVWCRGNQDSVIKVIMPNPDFHENQRARRIQVSYLQCCQQRIENRHFPRFYKHDYQFVKVLNEGLGFVSVCMERLYPLGAANREILEYLSRESDYNSIWLFEKIKYYYKHGLNKLPEQLGSFYRTASYLQKQSKFLNYGFDLRTENVMQRKDGTLVIIDPWS